MFPDNYPYTNFHELNLGYFIIHFREIFSQWADLYDQMLGWKNATDTELESWKTSVEADLDQREDALRAELETWKAQTGQDIAGWEDATLAALTAWQTATQAVFEAIRVEAAGSATAAAASATQAATAKTAAETAQAAAEAAAASVQASATQIATNTADITDLKTQLNNKYDRYTVEDVPGLSLDMFDICPPQYTIVQYDGTDALQHGAITGISFIFSKLDAEYNDVKFKVSEQSTSTTPSLRISVAATSEKAIAVSLNATSNNFNLVTASGFNALAGQYRNTNCRNVVAGDIIHIVKKDNSIALYLIDNNIDIPILANEFIDIYDNYAISAGISESDIGIGFASSNSARNVPLVYNFSHEVEYGDHFMNYDEVDERLSALENGAVTPNTYDLILFMGQSNMAGRGSASQAPDITAGAGYEFRAISDPSKLYPISEPFGYDENNENGINDILGGYRAKTGDIVAAFVNAYFKYTRYPIVGVSASEGGTRIASWQPNTDRYNDAVSRFNSAISYLTNNGYTIRHKYMIWCQGESDGDAGMSIADYKSAFDSLASAWFANGIEKIFIIKIGKYNGSGTQTYEDIMTAQNQIAQEKENIIMISTDFAGMKDRGLMKDDFHYYQAAYNEVGNYSAINMAIYVNTEKEPNMYDTQNGTLYYTHKN